MQDHKRATSIRMIKPNVGHCLCVWAWIHSLGPLSHFSESPSRRICGQTHIHFYCGSVCENTSEMIDTLYVCVCACVLCIEDTCLDCRHVRVADDSELAHLCVWRLMGGTGQRQWMRDRLTCVCVI